MTSLALIALLLGGFARAESDDPAPEKGYDRALVLYLNGDLRQALTAVETVMDERAGRPAAYALRARLWYSFGLYQEMRDDANRALAEFQKVSNPAAEDFIARGNAQLLLEDLDGADSSFQAALKWPLESTEALAGKARVMRARGDAQKALALFSDAIKDTPRPLYFYGRAGAYYDLGQYDQVIAQATQALRLNKKFYPAFGLVGAALAKKGDVKRAAQAYTKALSIEPGYVFALLGRAALSSAAGAEAAAMHDFDEAAKANVRDASVYLNRADVYVRKGNRDAALAELNRAAGADVPDASGAAQIADQFAALGFWPEAMAAYNRAYKMKPSAAVLVKRAVAREALKDPHGALQDLSEAVSLEPAAAGAWSAKGLLETRTGRDSDALSDLNRAVKLDDKNPGAYVARGSFFSRTAKPKAALDDFNAAISLAPQTAAEAYNDRGALYANVFTDYGAALRDISAAVAMKPKEAAFHFNLGAVQLKARSFSDSIASFDTALRLKGPVSRVLQYRADAYSQMGKQTEAMKDITTAIEHDSKNAALHDALGAIRMRLGDYDLAGQDLTEAVNLDGKNQTVLLHRGAAWANAGQLKRALADFKKAVELDSRSKEALTELCHLRRLLKDPKESVALCSQAIDIDQAYAPAYAHRALSYLKLSEPFKAAQDVEKAKHLGLRWPELFLAESIAHAMSKQYQQAHEAFVEATALDPNVHSPVLTFGKGRGDVEDYYNAIIELDVVMEGDVSDPNVYLVRGDAQYNAGHYDKAIQEYTKAMEIDGTLAEAYGARGDALLAQDALDAAHQDYLRAVELDAKDKRHRLRLVEVLIAKRSYKAAIEKVGDALAVDSQDPEAYIKAGNAYYFLGNYKRALENYQLAAKIDPLSAAAFNGVGLGYFAQHEYLEALDNFSRAISLNPRSDRAYKNRGSTFTNMKEYADAAADFKSASLVNGDPSLNEEYAALIKQAEARVAQSSSAAPPQSD